MQLDNVEDVYPLSPMQQGILFHSLFTPGLDVYFQQFSCRVRGDFDVAAFKQAWQRTMDRHSILRTAFFWEGLDEPLQVVRQQVSLPWEHIDWRTLSTDEQKSRLRAYLKADLSKGVDFREAPLMRLAIVELAENAHQFIWSLHHLVLDGWSRQSLLQEVFAFYEAFRQGLDLKLPRCRPYRDYIAWLSKQNLSQAEEFWRAKLKGLSGATEIEMEAGSGHPQGYGEEAKGLGKQATARLQALAREHRLTFNTVTQGAWTLLLSRSTGAHDVVFGTTVSGRPAELTGVDGMVGVFINTLPMRVEIRREDKVSAWLQDLQQQLIEMRQYEFSPLIQIQGWSEVPRGKELFKCLYVFENYPVMRPLEEPGAQFDIGDVRLIERSNYPLTVELVLREELHIKFTYDKSHYGEQTIKRMSRHYEQVLQSIIENPDRRIADIDILTPEEKQQLLVEWNNKAKEYGGAACVHESIEEQARKTPDCVAAVYEQEQVTYAELNRRANQLAHYLRGNGVGPEVLVGLCLKRSVEMVVGVLAVLKAGGAYLPLDPDYPAHRLNYMLEDSRAGLVLTESGLAERLASYAGDIICVDHQWQEIARRSAQNLEGITAGDHLAYVIYTSGSTGKPKGALITHGGLINYLQWAIEAYELHRGDGAPVHSPITSDLSVTSLFAPLLAGKRLVLVSEGYGVEGLRAALEEQADFSLLKVTPAHLEILNQQLSVAALRCCCRVLVIGGEALAAEKLGRFRQEARQTRLINEYGPTETVVGCCVYEVRESDARSGPVRIGRGIANTWLYIVDQQGEVLPIGVRGELHIGGAGVARGYLNRAELTAEKFVPNQNGREAGERVYRTGDVARYNEEGEIEFLGRVDEQVKLRGYRIEPGEIEAAVKEHPAIEECVVVARETAEGDKRLIGYVVCKGGKRVGVKELRSHLSESLPEYMVPAAFVTIAGLPLSVNGKIDRRALPDEESANAEAEARYIGPRTMTEEVIAGIWAEVFRLERVGIRENFFELGGHSLLAMQVISRMRDAFKVRTGLRTIFDKPTVEELARSVEKAIKKAEGIEVPALQQGVRGVVLRMSFAQERLWFLDQLEPGSPAYNSRVAARLEGPLNYFALKQALTEIVRRHEVLRTSFPAVNGRPSPVITQPQPISFPIADLVSLEPSERESAARRLIAREVRRVFDLSSGPVIRAYLVRLSAKEHIVLLVIHHIAFDAWSSNVLLREMAALYEAFCRGGASPLEELPIQYADYAYWQREWLQGEALRSLLSYWKQQLGGAPALLSLPTARPRPTESNSRGATIEFSLTEDLTASLRALSREENATLFMTLMAAFQILLSRYSGQEDISVGTPVAGRDGVETEGLIGCFINTLVVRNRLPGDLRFREFLQRVRHGVLEAFAHQELPFEKIIETLGIERNPSYTPLFQVLLGLVKTPVNRLGGIKSQSLAISLLPTDAGTANLDLIMEVRDIGGRLVGGVEYRTDLFNHEAPKRMIDHFETLLKSIVANPDARLSMLEMLTEAERQQQDLRKSRRAELNRQRLITAEPRAVKLD